MSAETSDRAGKTRLWRDGSGGCNVASKERDLELVNGYCSQSLSEGEFAELEQRLRQSSEVRQLLVEYRAVESALPSVFACSGSQSAITTPAAKKGVIRRLRMEVLAMSVPTLVREGQAVRASEGSNVITRKEYDVAVFKNTWPVNSGVLQATGAIRFVSPGPDFLPGQLEDNKHIIVFPERRDVELAEPLHVDITDPGEYIYIPNKEKETIKAGRRLSSFLLQLRVRDRGKDNGTKVRAIGQITFATPIAGVIATNYLLDESEVIFGNSKVSYEVPRGTEPRVEGSNKRTIYDHIILAADQRTLILDLQVAPKKLDQLRILVEAESL